MQCNRMEQLTNGWGWPNWAPNSFEECRDACRLWVEFGIPPVLCELARQIVIDKQREEYFLEQRRRRIRESLIPGPSGEEIRPQTPCLTPGAGEEFRLPTPEMIPGAGGGMRPPETDATPVPTIIG